jgi:hypothetical protein
MNKKQILASLNKISNELDNSRLYKEATSVTSVMKRIASNPDYKVNDEMFDDMETIFNPFPQVREPGYNIQEGTPEYGKALFMEEIKSIIGDYTPDQQQIIATHVSHLIELDERRRQVAIQNLYDEIKNNGEFHIIYGGIIDLIQFTEDFAEESQIPLEELGSKLEDFQGFYPDSRVKLSNKKDKQMNKRQIIASLNKIANELDNTGLYKEATSITGVMMKIAQEDIPTDLNQDFSPKKESYENQGRNIVREIMKIIANKLRDNEAARKRFSGGQLQSFVFSILDILVSEGMNKAFSELNNDLREYGVIIEQDDLYMLFRDYSRSNRNNKD